MAKKLTDVASSLASRSAPDREIIYIVDFENIPKTDVAALLRKKHVVMVVLAANRTNTVTPETLKTIEANPDRVDVIIGRITRKEFVDKLVTAKIGEYAFRYPNAELIVLANDKDYADLANHLNDHWERPVPIVHVAPDTPGSRRRRRTSPKPSSAPSASSSKPRARGKAKPDAESAGKEAPKSSRASRKQGRDQPAQSPSRRSASKPSPKQAPKPSPKQAPKQSPKQAPKQAPKRSQKQAAKQTPKQTPKQSPKQAPKQQGSHKPASAPRTAITNPDAEAVRGLLANLSKSRLPRSESALLNAVRNYRESVGLRSRPSTIIKHLEDCGVLDLSASPVGYNLGK